MNLYANAVSFTSSEAGKSNKTTFWNKSTCLIRKDILKDIGDYIMFA